MLVHAWMNYIHRQRQKENDKEYWNGLPIPVNDSIIFSNLVMLIYYNIPTYWRFKKDKQFLLDASWCILAIQ